VVSIWASLEVLAWSRDFDYENYLHLHSLQQEPRSKPLCKDAYKIFCTAMQLQMTTDITQQTF